MPQKYCFVANCKSSSSKTKQIAFFRVNDDETRKLWEEAIKKPGMLLGSRVCSVHFEPSCIIKTRGIIPLKKWRLHRGSIPTLNLAYSPTKKKTHGKENVSCGQKGSSAKTTSSHPQQKNNENEAASLSDLSTEMFGELRRSVATPNLVFSPAKKETHAKENVSCGQKGSSARITTLQPQQKNNENEAASLSDFLSTEMLGELRKSVSLPASEWFWTATSNSKQALCSISIPSSETMLIKTVLFKSPTTIKYFVNGKPVEGGLKTFTSYAELECLLKKFHSKSMCEGIQDKAFNFLELTGSSSGVREVDGTLRSKRCSAVKSIGNMCPSCAHYLRYLKQNAKSLQSSLSEGRLDEIEALKRRITHDDQIILELKEKCATLASDCAKVINEAKENSMETLMRQMEQLHIWEKSMLRLNEMREPAVRDAGCVNLSEQRYEESDANFENHVIDVDDSVTDETLNDPFIRTLEHLAISPLGPPSSCTDHSISRECALQAKASLPFCQKKSSAFVLPGKKRAEQLAEKAQLPQYSIPAVMGSGILPTRDDLLKRIEAALMVGNTSAGPNANQPERCTVYFPTIEQVADSWRLKGKQRDAFRLMSTAMLQKIHANNCVQPHEDNVRSHAITNSLNAILPNNKRLCMYFGGAAGTGKSTVIHALVNFADMWCSTASVVVCASSGIAAMLIGGSTVHSALGIRPNGPHRCPSAAMRKAWSEVEILIIDECSLIDAELLDVLDKRLRQLKFKEDVPFGGIHVVFSGDFYQLAPVGASLISSNLSDNPRLATLRGRELWKTSITDVIELEDNHRQTDGSWAASLLRWRTNTPTLADIDAVNSRLITIESLNRPPIGTVTAVATNKTREQTVRYAQHQFVRALPPIRQTDDLSGSWRRRGAILIKASLKPKSLRSKLSTDEENLIRQHSDTALDTVGNLYCVLAAPYMVSANEDVAHGVANGTVCYLRDVILSPSARVTIETLPRNVQVHCVSADDVECLVLEHRLEKWNCSAAFETLPVGMFPLSPQTSTIDNPLAKTRGTPQIRITQFPCKSAVALTVHKTQGQTLASVLLGPANRHFKYGAQGWLYVILSRVPTLDDLFITESLPRNPLEFKPRIDVIEEMKRLHEIERETLRRIKPADEAQPITL